MEVREATEADEVRACYPVVAQLRTDLDEEGFVEQVQRQREDGYRLVYLEEDGEPVAAAGFRVVEMLARGRCLYVDDLVTLEERRGEGIGSRLLDWLVGHAREQDCKSVDLDSGFDRERARRFYEDRGFERVATHFRRPLK